MNCKEVVGLIELGVVVVEVDRFDAQLSHDEHYALGTFHKADAELGSSRYVEVTKCL